MRAALNTRSLTIARVHPNHFRWQWTGLISLIALGILTSAEPVRTESIQIAAHSLLPQASVGKDYRFQFRTAGKPQSVDWNLVSPAPGRKDWEGWTLDSSGRLSGKANGAACDSAGAGCPEGWICRSGKRCEGVVSLYVSASNSKGQFEQRLFDLVVTDPVNPFEVGNFATLTSGAVGQSYEMQLYARGGTAPFSWKNSADALPPGLALDSDGVLSGTPTAPGTFSWTVEVTDSTSKRATKKLSLRIDDVSKPIVFTLNPKVVIRSVTPRIGVNVGDELSHWDDRKLANQYIQNPGLEPRPPVRRMFLAWAGTANTLEEREFAQFLEVEELKTGFWNGGHYWILSGPAKGREGRIAKYERISDKSVEGGYRAVWTLADSDPSRVIEKKPAKELDKNIFMVESLPRNVTDKSFQGTAPPGWWVMGADESKTFSVENTKGPDGTQSAKIVSTQDGSVGLLSVVSWQNPWRRLRKDTTFAFSIDVRQSGTADSSVKVQMAEPFWTTDPFFVQSFHVPDDGRFHHLAGQFAGNGRSTAGFQVLLEQKGTLWLDNALLYESTSNATPANGDRQPSVRSKPFEPLPFIVDDLRKLRAGCLRFWYHDTWLPLANALTASSEAAPGPSHNLFFDLKLAETVGANAWIIAAKEWLPVEFAQLAEYLSSKDITHGLGKLRAEQGHPPPWTDTVARIYIEYVDEAWNYPGWAYPFDPWHPNKYASFAKERFSAFRASKYYSPKVTLVANGQIGDDYWVNDPVDKLAYPSHDAMDMAPYTDTFLPVPLNELSATVLGEEIGFTKTMLATVNIWTARGEKTRMLNYEGGPGTASHNPSAADEVRKNSITLASLSLDSMADLLANGADEYAVFGYQNNLAWQVTTGSSSRFRLPIWYAVSMFNSAAGDHAQIDIKTPAGAPSLKPIVDDGAGKRSDGDLVPAISARGYVKGGRLSVLLINRNPLVAYPVSLRAMDSDVPYRVTTLTASRGDRGTLEGPGLLPTDPSERDLSKIFETVQPRAESVKSADGGVRLTLPPASIVTVEAILGGQN